MNTESEAGGGGGGNLGSEVTRVGELTSREQIHGKCGCWPLSPTISAGFFGFSLSLSLSLSYYDCIGVYYVYYESYTTQPQC